MDMEITEQLSHFHLKQNCMDVVMTAFHLPLHFPSHLLYIWLKTLTELHETNEPTTNLYQTKTN